MAGKAIRQSINPGTKAFCFVFVFCGQVLVKLGSLSVVLSFLLRSSEGCSKIESSKKRVLTCISNQQ